GHDRVVLALTASLPVPVLVEVAPGAHDDLDQLIDQVGGAHLAGSIGWFEDTHGTADWRGAMTRRLAHKALDELGGAV
ncbi:hypothetical protein, partial [Promicromonospora kroppenstedtii]|uniref:hypothetical protein n=1 Tax=Promicromonospora kroppenstedtii TaxID=440482 RepID=UPI001B7F8E6E